MSKNKQTRYMVSAGLAFSEEREMCKLSRMAAKGWLLESFSFAGFTLRRGNPQELIYCLDMQTIPADEQEEYHDTFRASGWQPVCFVGNMHIFSAAPGTKPIYSDRSSLREKYIRANRMFKRSAIIFGLLTLFGLIATYLTEKSESTALPYNIAWVLTLFFLVLATPSWMVYIAYRVRLQRLK
ncbi:MAG: DUF2812 domain-containing protein [Gorillibacterium sp.]|nr:DUF2812 domain-containing protein [Gorillibacterium sp.]